MIPATREEAAGCRHRWYPEGQPHKRWRCHGCSAVTVEYPFGGLLGALDRAIRWLRGDGG